MHRSRHPFLHRPMCAFDPLSRFLMLPASKVHVGAGRELTTLLNICSSLPTSGTYSVQSSCLNQITLWNSMKFSDTLRSVRSLWSPLRLPTPAAEQLPNAAFLFASSGRTAPQPPAGRPRWPLGTACGQERPADQAIGHASRRTALASRRTTPPAASPGGAFETLDPAKIHLQPSSAAGTTPSVGENPWAPGWVHE